MSGQPVTTKTDEDDVILRFLRAADARAANYGGRVPLNTKECRAAISWLRALVGRLNDDGSLEGQS